MGRPPPYELAAQALEDRKEADASRMETEAKNKVLEARGLVSSIHSTRLSLNSSVYLFIFFLIVLNPSKPPARKGYFASVEPQVERMTCCV